jgi:hypothetical protein
MDSRTKRSLHNVTITLDKETHAKARIRAAETNLSLSRFIGEVVRGHLGKEDAYEAAYRAFRAEKPLKLSGRYLTREEANDRAGLRRR